MNLKRREALLRDVARTAAKGFRPQHVDIGEAADLVRVGLAELAAKVRGKL